MNTLDKLENDYCAAVVALLNYREKNGFVPGARVLASLLGAIELSGTIAPYGQPWPGDVLHVQVMLDNGPIMSWPVSGLTLLKEQP